jgi:hypothetical protein
MTSMRWLFAASPGTMAAPKSPPFNNAARLSTRSPDFCFSGPWQSKQRFLRTGSTSFSKSGTAASDRVSGASSRAMKRRRQKDGRQKIGLRFFMFCQ